MTLDMITRELCICNKKEHYLVSPLFFIFVRFYVTLILKLVNTSMRLGHKSKIKLKKLLYLQEYNNTYSKGYMRLFPTGCWLRTSFA